MWWMKMQSGNHNATIETWQSFTADPVQPTTCPFSSALTATKRVTMSSSSDTGARAGAAGGASIRHPPSSSSPLSNFSLDIPSGIWPTHLTTLPHQSYSVPLVPHLMRTHSTHEKSAPVKVRITQESFIIQFTHLIYLPELNHVVSNCATWMLYVMITWF